MNDWLKVTHVLLTDENLTPDQFIEFLSTLIPYLTKQVKLSSHTIISYFFNKFSVSLYNGFDFRCSLSSVFKKNNYTQPLSASIKDVESCERKCSRFVEGSVEVDSGYGTDEDDEGQEVDVCSLRPEKVGGQKSFYFYFLSHDKTQLRCIVVPFKNYFFDSINHQPQVFRQRFLLILRIAFQIAYF